MPHNNKNDEVILVIEKAWGDDMENDSSNAFGYSVIGYIFESELTNEMKNMLEQKVGKDFSWACEGNEPLYKIRNIPKFNMQ